MQLENDSDFKADSASPQRFSQQKLNNLIRYLNLPKKSLELLTSRLSKMNIYQSTNIAFYQTPRYKSALVFL